MTKKEKHMIAKNYLQRGRDIQRQITQLYETRSNYIDRATSTTSLSDVFGQTDIPNVGDYTSGFNDAIANSGVGDSIGNIDDNTGKIKDSLEVSEDELKYLRDIAEQEAINRFTTAEINVDMSGMQNTVNSGDDIDGFMTKLTDSVNEAVDNMTEGVHE